jgi:hypothetical protein
LGTLDFFGAGERTLKQTVLDLKHYRYRVFDWLRMCLQGRCDTQHIHQSQNIFVAMGNVYVNTTTIEQFVDFLRYVDLEPWRGRFNTAEFVKMVQRWNADDLKWKASQEYRKALSSERRQ